ncbi:MAG: UPF0489 family protein [Clostridia bacterium]|nr:UPF0489 family protein [Clostridia bacterium]
MQRVLDIDLDFFLADCCPLADMGERPALLGHEPWTKEAVETFLQERCLLNSAAPIPGRVFTTHDGALVWWKELMENKQLQAPFHVTHIDAHSDLGIGYPGPNYVLYNVLSLPPQNRLDLDRFYREHKLDEANYLLFALAARIIGALDNVRRPFSKADIPSQILSADGKHIRLPQAFPGLFEKQNGPEPVIPFLHIQKDDSFQAAAPYDFVSLAISPRYAPKEADALVPVFERYMKKV